MMDLIDRALRQVKQRLFNFARLGVLRLLTEGDTQTAQVSMMSGELGEAPFLEPYGLTAKPVVGSECLVLNLGGEAARPLVIWAGSRLYRFKSLKDGEVCLYTNEDGCRIHLKQGGKIEICGKDVAVRAENGCSVTANSLTAEISGEAKVTGNRVTVEGNQVSITSPDLTIASNAVSIGGGQSVFGNPGTAKAVARVGDYVEITSGTSAGKWPIVGGSKTIKVE